MKSEYVPFEKNFVVLADFDGEYKIMGQYDSYANMVEDLTKQLKQAISAVNRRII